MLLHPGLKEKRYMPYGCAAARKRRRDFTDVERMFLEMGFDRVFSPSADVLAVTRLLRDDIAESERGAAEEMVDQMADFAASLGRADGELFARAPWPGPSSASCMRRRPPAWTGCCRRGGGG
jgi:hypothetical protein